MAQTGAFGNSRRTAGIEDERQVFLGIDGDRRSHGLRLSDRVVKGEVAGFVLFGLGDLPEQSSDEGFYAGQIGLDVADHHGVHVGVLDRPDGGSVKLRVVHDEDHFCSGILELKIEFRCGIKGVARDADGPRLENAEEDLGVMGDVGQEDSGSVPLGDALRRKEVRQAFRSVFGLRKRAGPVVEDGEGAVRKLGGGFVDQAEQRFFEAADFMRDTFGPPFAVP